MATVKISIGNKSTLSPNSTSGNHTKYVFKDIDGAFIADETGSDLNAIYDYRSINNSLNSLFSYNKGERILNQEYGCDLRQYLYEPINNSTASAIGLEITNSLKDWEPRIKLESLNIVPRYEDNEYRIYLVYSVPALSARKTYNYEYSLTR